SKFTVNHILMNNKRKQPLKNIKFVVEPRSSTDDHMITGFMPSQAMDPKVLSLSKLKLFCIDH
ncbi:MAG: hypothetical protein ACXAB7_19260, partial [Candidatus Kariarchaeaceae archaeon]